MKNNIKNEKININVSTDGNSLNDFLWTWDIFQNRPNKVIIHCNYITSSFIEYMGKKYEIINQNREIIPDKNSTIINDKIFLQINDNIYCSYIIINKNHEDSIVGDLVFYYRYNRDLEYIETIVNGLSDFIVDYDNNINKLNTISMNQNEMELEPIDIADIDIDNFELFYSKETFYGVKKMIKNLKKSKKGINILYGEVGTGKTSVINYISSELDRTIIYIPNNLLDNTVNNPEFRNFLKTHTNPILIFDDCDLACNEYHSKYTSFSTNLIQLVDGFLSDSLEITVITIFNSSNIYSIDKSIRNCNSVIDIVEFKELPYDESVELSKFLNHNKKFINSLEENKKYTLSEIVCGKIKDNNKNYMGLY